MRIKCPVCGWIQLLDAFHEHHFRTYQDNSKYHPLTCINGCGKMIECIGGK